MKKGQGSSRSKTKFKFPKELLIKDSIWKIKYVRKIREHGNTKNRETLGLCCPGDKIIYIKSGLPFQLKLDTVLHEVLHSLEEELGIELDHKHVYMLGEGLAKLFIDNF